MQWKTEDEYHKIIMYMTYRKKSWVRNGGYIQHHNNYTHTNYTTEKCDEELLMKFPPLESHTPGPLRQWSADVPSCNYQTLKTSTTMLPPPVLMMYYHGQGLNSPSSIRIAIICLCLSLKHVRPVCLFCLQFCLENDIVFFYGTKSPPTCLCLTQL